MPMFAAMSIVFPSFIAGLNRHSRAASIAEATKPSWLAAIGRMSWSLPCLSIRAISSTLPCCCDIFRASGYSGSFLTFSAAPVVWAGVALARAKVSAARQRAVPLPG